MSTKLLLLLLERNTKVKHLLECNLRLFSFLSSCKWKSLKKFRRKQGRRKRRTIIRRIPPLVPRKSVFIHQFDVYERSGIFEDQFEEIYEHLQYSIASPRQQLTTRTTACTLTTRVRLLLLLYWIRDNPSFWALWTIFYVSKGTISKEIRWIIPKLFCYLDEIYWSLTQTPFLWKYRGAIDCASHYRWQVHSRQVNYYWGDKGRFFSTAQVICTVWGEIISVTLGLGHNNDQGMFKLTGMRQMIQDLNMKLLADRGYSHYLLVTPDDRKSTKWNHMQKGMRSIVKVTISMAENFRVAGERFKQSPEMQEMAVLIAYQLANINLKRYPLRLSDLK